MCTICDITMTTADFNYHTSHFQITCISVVTIILMHEGCCTVNCGSTTCGNYNGLVMAVRFLVINVM